MHVGSPLVRVYGISEKADSRIVARRLSDAWRINYRVANGQHRIFAMLDIYYAEPVNRALSSTSAIYRITGKDSSTHGQH